MSSSSKTKKRESRKCKDGCSCGRHNRVKKVEIICDSCGAKSRRYHYHVRKTNFCGTACMGQYQSEVRGPQGKCKEGCTCKRHDRSSVDLESAGRKISLSKRKLGSEKVYTLRYGYDGHPLADRHGKAYVHRVTLYDKIGPGPHECHWGCGKVLEWGGKEGIHADHLDGNRKNNNPDNLVQSCLACNLQRGRDGNPLEWRRENE